MLSDEQRQIDVTSRLRSLLQAKVSNSQLTEESNVLRFNSDSSSVVPGLLGCQACVKSYTQVHRKP